MSLRLGQFDLVTVCFGGWSAVVPPPHPRPKQVFFSAVLHLADSWEGCGLGREFWETKTLRIPAKVRFLRQLSEFTSTWLLFVLELVADDEYTFYLFGKDLPISSSSHRQL